MIGIFHHCNIRKRRKDSPIPSEARWRLFFSLKWERTGKCLSKVIFQDMAKLTFLSISKMSAAGQKSGPMSWTCPALGILTLRGTWESKADLCPLEVYSEE